jgi:subtilase family serine protease
LSHRLFALVLIVSCLLVRPADAAGARDHAICPATRARVMRCFARFRGDAATAARRPYGLTPAAIKAAYNFSTDPTAGQGRTIAIVGAYNAPHVEGDLSVFSHQYGLPACTTANRCFLKVSQTGSTSSYPSTDAGWALETSMDVEWAHAIAPGADIILVEATNASISNLMKAEDYAKAHAEYVSNSWGGSELSDEARYDTHFVQTGVSFFVASGDDGFGAEYPSSSPNVISVGGTSLTGIGTSSFKETGWSGSGGGCSKYEAGRAEQTNFSQYPTTCQGKRATPDAALDADPSSGVSVYDSTAYNGSSGWFDLGGTSAATPMWTGRAADTRAVVTAKYVYGRSIHYRDITSGNNGSACRVGFDLVTGRGSWTG